MSASNDTVQENVGKIQSEPVNMVTGAEAPEYLFPVMATVGAIRAMVAHLTIGLEKRK
jgi:hypothetical protein